MPRPAAAERFAAKVNTAGPVSLYRDAPGPCHLWTGGARSKRQHDAGEHGEFYGTFRDGDRTIRAHRYAYELAYGPLPEPVDDDEPRPELDHKCRRRNCVNPAHLELTDHRTNTLRSTAPTAANARKTRCDKGHPFDDANTYRDRHGHRRCRTCRRHSRARARAVVTTLPAPTLERQAA
ncbi:HNH endonuclease [Streptomyces montanisoli]|uniref:HNH endonuclease n=1 Tax=Streptomyces montanisoli TaxID=2798581 RepID=A0A940MA00_9ACTN|nr:HNH endonuclease [Streptomyces montanisoli]MBP0456230.1 HNH endonuclease [Streptomyces montanisoli]